MSLSRKRLTEAVVAVVVVGAEVAAEVSAVAEAAEVVATVIGLRRRFHLLTRCTRCARSLRARTMTMLCTAHLCAFRAVKSRSRSRVTSSLTRTTILPCE